MVFEGGKFIEQPVDELAKKILALGEQCDRRDAEKVAAARAAVRQSGDSSCSLQVDRRKTSDDGQMLLLRAQHDRLEGSGPGLS